MPVDLQAEASRLITDLSDPPRASEGPARSALHALRSGLDADSQFVYGEESADFVLVQQRYFDCFRPVTPVEAFYVDSMIRNDWSLRRLHRAEAHLWEYYVICANRHEGVPLGEGFAKGSLVFMRLQRRLTATERSYNEAFATVTRLQSARQPSETTGETSKLGSILKIPIGEPDPLPSAPVSPAAPQPGPPASAGTQSPPRAPAAAPLSRPPSAAPRFCAPRPIRATRQFAGAGPASRNPRAARLRLANRAPS